MSTDSQSDDVTFDDLLEVRRRSREAFEAAERARGAEAGDRGMVSLAASGGPRGVLAAVAGSRAEPYVARCVGGCEAAVRWRGDWCATCAEASRRRALEIALAPAYAAVSPDGSRDWCRVGDKAFEAAMVAPRRGDGPPGLRVLYAAMPLAERDMMTDTVMRGRWPTVATVAIVGPLGIGKTPLLSALALGALDACRDGKVAPGSPMFAALAGLRYVSGIELSKDERRHALGREESPLIRMAKRCPILIMDEVGYGEEAEVSAVREIVRARYERGNKPILFGSGMTIAELNKRFGEATMKSLWGRGRVIDLHLKQARGAA